MTASCRTDALPVTFGLLLNLVGVMGATRRKEQVWGYLAQLRARRDARRTIPSSTS